jgi:hypothetical protein
MTDTLQSGDAAAAEAAAAREMIFSSLKAAGLAMDLSRTEDGLEIPELGKDTTRTVTLNGKETEIGVRPLMGIFSQGGNVLYFLPTDGEVLSRILSMPEVPNQRSRIFNGF